MSEKNRTYSRGLFVKTLGVAAIASFFTSKLMTRKQNSSPSQAIVTADKRAVSRNDFI